MVSWIFGRDDQFQMRIGRIKTMLLVIIAVIFVFVFDISFAAEILPKYQIVTGNDDKAYLLNTSTGFVWVLTYRTLATGREPIAVPYKFIGMSPQSQKEFLVEDAQNIPKPFVRTP